jgi:hypothetical protein
MHERACLSPFTLSNISPQQCIAAGLEMLLALLNQHSESSKVATEYNPEKEWQDSSVGRAED